MSRTLGVGVVGLGFMGRTHVRAWQAAAAGGAPARLVAVCDPSAERRAGRLTPIGNLPLAAGDERLFDPAQVRGHAEVGALLEDPAVELVSVCTPTDTHVALATRALEAGKHVLVEKPVALRSAEVERLIAVQRASGRVCMPAHCMRFWPGWSWLKERVGAGDLGAVRGATFHRLGTSPSWSRDFYGDPARSGGALHDLHVHDADVILWCFGAPESVASTGSLDHVTTLYRFPGGPGHVVAEAGVDHAPGFGFRMRYTVVFERATADFDLGREPRLVLARDGRAEPVALPDDAGLGGYVGEVAECARAALEGRAPAVTLEDALAVARLLEAERESLRSGAAVRLA